MKRELATKLNQAISSCGNFYPPEEVLTLCIDALRPTVCSVVAHYRESRSRATYLDVVGYSEHEGDAVRARTSTPPASRVAKPLQKHQMATLLHSPGDYNPTSKSSFSNPTTQSEALDSKNLMHHGRRSLESESTQEPPVSEKTDSALALGHHTVPASRLSHADRRAQYVRPSWLYS